MLLKRSNRSLSLASNAMYPTATGRALISLNLCREMSLHRSDNYLLRLAPDNLQSLSFRPFVSFEADSLVSIARLSALSRLEFIQLRPDTNHRHEPDIPILWDFEPLHQLPLVELVIINSHKFEQKLLRSGAFSKLQKLHIEESIDETPTDSEDDEHSEQQQQQQQQRVLERTRDAVFSLPSLLQVSGASSIFEAVQDHQLWHWQQMQTIEPPMTKHTMTEHASLACWRRP